MEGHQYDSLASKKFRMQPSEKKLLFTVFCNAKHVYITEYLEAVMTVNSVLCIEILKQLRRRVSHV